MKNLIFSIFSIALLFSFTACNNGPTSANNQSNEKSVQIAKVDSNTIQVYYFHGSIRCHTCVSVDENTHQYLKDFFPEEMGKGQIIFQSINIDENERLDLIKKHEIYGQTLLFIKGDQVVDETEDAFQYVTTNPEKWKSIVENLTNSLLN